MDKKINSVKIAEKGRLTQIYINGIEQTGVIGYQIYKKDFDSYTTLDLKLVINEIRADFHNDIKGGSLDEN
ncbi:hypothetical protein [Anaerotruncus rubiinfantis]|uniref:hypothetical protein n=1 Tax=Anaerotruncus rubiinfantis TaxID=1720200 RepID=UPI001897B896|nr:hypothetical protein [Anaerotruncus rubiinfantis]